jgi:dTDP-4-amino-4,6-dideoxygalactose transaminase
LAPLDIPIQHPDTYSSFHLYIIQLDLSKLNKSHREIFQLLRKNGLGVNLHYIPVHFHPYYQKLGFKKGDFPKSEFYYKRSISIPIFPRMSHDDINFVISTLKEVIN